MSKNIAILASGNGTNAENIIRYFQNSESVNIGLVLANRETALVLERARSLNVPFACMGKTEWVDGTAVLALLEERGIDFIVLAGFLARIPDCILHAYPNKIINIHPSLLPKFGGKGMYGDRVHEAVVAADNAIKRKSREEKSVKSMGTTLVAAWLFDGYANIIWCGDSRGYLFNPVSGLAQVTKDHSYVQELVDSGRLLPEYAFDHPDNNIITRSLGNPQKAANPDFVRLPLQEGEVILLCTDGLNSMLRDEEIEAVMQETSNEIDTCTKALIQGALDLGGHDNVTVVLCQIVPEENKPSVQDMQQTVSTFTEKERKKPLRKFVLWTVAFVFVLLLACLAWSFSTAWQNKIIQWYEQTVK